MTNASGQLVKEIGYKPFGEIAYANDFLSTNVAVKYQFTGQEKDATGLMDYGARMYDPELGRFISPDPFLPELNRYTYCFNNPIAYNDPTGYQATDSSGNNNSDPSPGQQISNFEGNCNNSGPSNSGDTLNTNGPWPTVWTDTFAHAGYYYYLGRTYGSDGQATDHYSPAPAPWSGKDSGPGNNGSTNGSTNGNTGSSGSDQIGRMITTGLTAAGGIEFAADLAKYGSGNDYDSLVRLANELGRHADDIRYGADKGTASMSAFKNLLNNAESVANKSKAAFAAANKASRFGSAFALVGRIAFWAGIGLMAYDTINKAVTVDPWAGAREGLRYGLSTTAGFFVGIAISGCSFGGATFVGIAAGVGMSELVNFGVTKFYEFMKWE